IIEHWNGADWSVVTVPNLEEAASLWKVSAVSVTDVWAVGYYDGGNRRWRTLALHWNGSTWSRVATPNKGDGSNYLFGVAAISPGDVWAVGSYCCVNYQQQTLTLHWDGSAWAAVTSPSVGALNNSLYAVASVP